MLLPVGMNPRNLRRPGGGFDAKLAATLDGDDSRRQSGIGAPARGKNARNVEFLGKEVAVEGFGKIDVPVFVAEEQGIDPPCQHLHEVVAILEAVTNPSP